MCSQITIKLLSVTLFIQLLHSDGSSNTFIFKFLKRVKIFKEQSHWTCFEQQLISDRETAESAEVFPNITQPSHWGSSPSHLPYLTKKATIVCEESPWLLPVNCKPFRIISIPLYTEHCSKAAHFPWQKAPFLSSAPTGIYTWLGVN